MTAPTTRARTTSVNMVPVCWRVGERRQGRGRTKEKDRTRERGWEIGEVDEIEDWTDGKFERQRHTKQWTQQAVET